MATSIIQGHLALFRLQSKQEKIEIDYVCGLIRTVAYNGHERAVTLYTLARQGSEVSVVPTDIELVRGRLRTQPKIFFSVLCFVWDANC